MSIGGAEGWHPLYGRQRAIDWLLKMDDNMWVAVYPLCTGRHPAPPHPVLSQGKRFWLHLRNEQQDWLWVKQEVLQLLETALATGCCGLSSPVDDMEVGQYLHWLGMKFMVIKDL